jgi:hypothetical protein
MHRILPIPLDFIVNLPIPLNVINPPPFLEERLIIRNDGLRHDELRMGFRCLLSTCSPHINTNCILRANDL